MENEPSQNPDEILIHRSEMDFCHHQKIAALAINDEFEHDPFIDNLPKIPYPEDAP